MAKRATLEDLYAEGDLLTFDPLCRRHGKVSVDADLAQRCTGCRKALAKEPITVWVQNLNTPEHEIAKRKAAAARATTLMWRHDPTSEGYLEVRDQIEGIEITDVIDHILADEMFERSQAAEAETAAEEEWSNDDYLDGLRDAWEPPDGEPGLKDVWARGPDDDETGGRYAAALKCLDEMKRFAGQVDETLQPIAEQLLVGMRTEPESELRDRCTKIYIKAAGLEAWTEEYLRCEMWLGTRLADDHAVRYLEDRKAVDRLPEHAFLKLRAAHMALQIGVVEGKDLGEAPNSSPSSELQAEEEPETSSGPVAVPA